MTTLGDWKVIEPEGYYKSFIEKQKRPDGRDWMESRSLLIKIGSITTADGSATVRLGNTSVVCGIKAEIATPTLRQPDRGFIVPNVELYPCCSPKFKAGPPGEKAIATSQFLRNVIQDSDLLDLSQLCVVSNKIAWCLYCDIICLDYDGNLNDTALLALVAALRNVRLPEISWDEENEKISEIALECTKQLVIKSNPVSTSFAMYGSEVHLLDPSTEDEEQSNGGITLVLEENGTICTTLKPGGRLISTDILEKFINIAKQRVCLVNKALDTALKLHGNKCL